MWQLSGHEDSVFKSSWPVYDPSAVIGDEIEIAVQINGKLRDTVKVPADSDQTTVEAVAFASDKVLKYTDGKQVVKKIYVSGPYH